MSPTCVSPESGVFGGLAAQVVQTEAGTIEYAEFGEGPVVVAIHGGLGGWDQGVVLARCAVPEGYRVLAISRAGYLGTPLARGETPEQQGDLVAALLKTLGVERAAVVALSGGGPCALAFALRYPRRCAGLVLVSACCAKNTAPVPPWFRVLKVVARLPWLFRLVRRRALANPARSLAKAARDPKSGRLLRADPERMALYRALLTSTFDRIDRRLPGTENDIHLMRTNELPLEEIQPPTLVIHGTADRLAPFAHHVPEFAVRVPGARIVAIEGGEHVVLFTHLGRVRTEVAGFLEAVFALV